jgi:hypothetical protein
MSPLGKTKYYPTVCRFIFCSWALFERAKISVEQSYPFVHIVEEAVIGEVGAISNGPPGIMRTPKCRKSVFVTWGFSS